MLSVIIPTLNARKYIDKLLDRLIEQKLPEGQELEIIVVDSQSEDETVELAKAKAEGLVNCSNKSNYSDCDRDGNLVEEIDKGISKDKCRESDVDKNSKVIIRVLPVARADFDHGTTRNYAWQQSKGEYVFFLTQDALPADDEYLIKLLSALSEEDIVMASARQIPYPDANPVERLTRAFNYPEISNVRSKDDIGRLGIKAYFFSDACALYRRSFLEQMGGFESPILTNEDMLAASRALASDKRVAYCAEAGVYHSHNFTLRYQYRRNFDVSIFLQMYGDEIESGSTTGEGIKMVLFTEKELFKHGHFISMFRCVFESGAKFLGNRAGKGYKDMPAEKIMKISSNPGYWRKRLGD